MTAEKQKRLHFSSKAVYGKKVSRRGARKLIRQERLAAKKMGLRKTRFLCPFCDKPLRLYQWLWERGQVIRCPHCDQAVMDIFCTQRVAAN
jgi:hypothetical protein